MDWLSKSHYEMKIGEGLLSTPNYKETDFSTRNDRDVTILYVLKIPNILHCRGL